MPPSVAATHVLLDECESQLPKGGVKMAAHEPGAARNKEPGRVSLWLCRDPCVSSSVILVVEATDGKPRQLLELLVSHSSAASLDRAWLEILQWRDALEEGRLEEFLESDCAALGVLAPTAARSLCEAFSAA
jgi:hypothetical protein